jgi:hypothetical protein
MVLILDGKTVVNGASEGLQLCIRVLIPTIFPFLVICGMVTASMPDSMSIFRPVGRLLRMPKGAEDLFILGLFSGYPVGAATVFQAYRHNQITKRDAQRLIAFCSNAGPSFIFGIGASLFPHIGYCFILWFVQILSAAIIGIMTAGKPEAINGHRRDHPHLQHILHNSISTMAAICSWVILFRILISVAERWLLWFFPPDIRILTRGILELANGIVSLAGIESIGKRMLLFSMLLSFGGICVLMQTNSVCQGISVRYYLLGKTAQCALSGLLATLLQFCLPMDQQYFPSPLFLCICVGICVAYPFLTRKMKNRCRNSMLVGV